MTKNKNSQENQLVKVEESNNQDQDLTPIFDRASLELQIKRHQTVGTLFDKAASVLDSFLDDTSVDLVAKMFPAKLAIDLYHTQEKLKREDEKLEIERRKLSIEEKKAGIPNSVTFNQQNNYVSNSTTNADLAEIKKKQEELLASFRSKPSTTDN